MILGPPGAGKSQSVKRAAASMDYLFKDLNLSSITSSNMSPLVGKESGIMNVTNSRHIIEISEASDL